MALRELKVSDFRCLESATLEPGARYSLISGANGAGKTSLLEAIYCLSRGRSFRGSPTDKLIRHGCSKLTLFGVVESIVQHRLGLSLARSGTEVRIDGETASSLSDLSRHLVVEVIDPDIHDLIAAGPENRRRFVDYGLFHVEHDYLQTWRRYRRALKQRNAALRAQASLEEIDTWTGQILAHGLLVDRYRRQHIEMLGEALHRVSEQLIPEAGLSIAYQPGWPREFTSLEDALAACRRRDLEFGTTHAGPHRADLAVTFRGRRARQQVSRGQQKLVAASLVLAQGELIESHVSTPTVLLLDDPAAELDESALARLLKAVGTWQGQVIVTALDPDRVELPADTARFHVEHGVLS